MISFRMCAVWLAILLLAIANGTLREASLVPALGLYWANIISGITLAAIVLLAAYFTLPWIVRKPVTGYAAIGSVWLCLTVVFEFTFGRVILGDSWQQMFESYMFRDGNVWPLVLLVIIVAPSLAAKIRGWK